MNDKSIQSMGGEARAKSLSEDARSEIARKAAAARWNIPKATHEGTIEIGEVVIPCAVLSDGRRVLTQSGFMLALGRSRQAKGRGYYDSDVNLPAFLTAKNLKQFISNELEVSSSQIEFIPIRGARAFGYSADLLPKVCEVFLKARDKGVLSKNQKHIAEQADILIRGLAHVGITALVDEATGYQDVRDRQALQKILEMFISKELLKWTKRFPDDFYKEMFRLKKWEYPRAGTSKPQVVGHYTNDVVYNRLAPSVLDELKKLNPPDERGNRPHKHHQWLTPDIGHPKLRDHISGVIALMKSADDWLGFKRILEKVYPKKKVGDTIMMEFE